MQQFKAIFIKNNKSSSELKPEIFSKLIVIECDSVSDLFQLYEKVDIFIIESDCIISDEDSLYCDKIKENENTPILIYFNSSQNCNFSFLNSWQYILSDYTIRELKNSIEFAIQQFALDKYRPKEESLYSNTLEKLEAQASQMALIIEKLAISQNKEQRASKSKNNFIKQVMFQFTSGMNNIFGLTQLVNNQDTNYKSNESIEEIRFACENLINQFQNILFLTHLENNESYFNVSETNLPFMVDNLVSQFYYFSNKRNSKFILSNNNLDGFFECHNEALQVVLFNLINFSLNCSTNPMEIYVNLKQELIENDNYFVCNIKLPITNLSSDKIEIVENNSIISTETLFENYDEEFILLVSNKIMETIGGRLTQSYNKEVLNFCIELPINYAGEINHESYTPYLTKILFVEDNTLSQQVGTRILERMLCTVEVAENGLRALEMLKKEKYELILMDCHMPILDGFETTKLIRQGEAGNCNTSIPIIALTASVLKEERDRCFEAGMNDYIGKPIRFENIISMLQKWANGNVLHENTKKQ